jgi:predicted ATPase/DNA-binding CsgD family transcriptional regulator
VRPQPLPAPLTALIGREAAIDEVARLLLRADVRLVTAIGPGGVGKTRLALAVAGTDSAERYFGDGIAFVSLAALLDGDLLPQAIAQALRVRVRDGETAIERLTTVLTGKRFLLVLDNLEHLPSAPAHLAELLTGCPDLKALVTSRSVLNVSGEFHVPVEPLPVPADDSLPEIESSAAVRLFVARATAVSPGFRLAFDNATEIAAICHRLDGLPLAIELAAAQMRLFSPPELLARMGRNLPLLIGGPHDSPARLQTMRDAIAWSYDLLNETEQVLFRMMSVFAGGFTGEAAEYVLHNGGMVDVVGGKPAPSLITLRTIGSLLDKSLLVSAIGLGGERRFSMLETIREFGREQLTLSGEDVGAGEALARYVSALAAHLDQELRRANPWQAARRRDDELDNVRAALSWLYDRRQPELAMRIVTELFWFGSDATLRREARTWLERLLEITDDSVSQLNRARALVHLVDHANLVCDFDDSRPLLEEALSIYRAEGDQAGVATCLRSLGNVEIGLGRPEVAKKLLIDAQHLARSAGDDSNIAATHYLLGHVARIQGNFESAIEHHVQARDLWRSRGYEAAAMMSAAGVAVAALMMNRLDSARSFGLEMLDFAVRHDDGLLAITSILVSGGLAVRTGQPREAVVLLGRALALEDARGSRWPPDVRASFDRWLATAKAKLDGHKFDIAWDEGVRLPTDEGLARARNLLAHASPRGYPGGTASTRADAARAFNPLTPRQQDVLRLMVAGMTDKQIADELFISANTVTNNHVQQILRRLGAKNRAEAVAIAVRDGLV